MALVSDEKWQKRFMELAHLIATWSKDSTKVGAVLVTYDCKIIGQGYNGPIASVDDSIITNRDIKINHTIHAEVNAIMDAAKLNNLSREVTYLFVTHPICIECAKLAAQFNINTIYCKETDDSDFNNRWDNSSALEVLKNSKVNYKLIK